MGKVDIIYGSRNSWRPDLFNGNVQSNMFPNPFWGQSIAGFL
jgi:hypothetical protein